MDGLATLLNDARRDVRSTGLNYVSSLLRNARDRRSVWELLQSRIRGCTEDIVRCRFQSSKLCKV